MAKARRSKNNPHKKITFPKLLICLILWTIVGCFIYFISPSIPGAVPLFLIALFLSLLFTSTLVLSHTRRGLITSSSITIFLVLRYFGVGNFLNLLLLLGAIITFEIYLSSNP